MVTPRPRGKTAHFPRGSPSRGQGPENGTDSLTLFTDAGNAWRLSRRRPLPSISKVADNIPLAETSYGAPQYLAFIVPKSIHSRFGSFAPRRFEKAI